MYIRTVEIFGFKSFATRTRLEFGTGITAVVGPNGSGKSNVFDAIRWCIGEQSARELRGGKMGDVLFHGSSTRQPTSVCSVDLVLDNTQHQAPDPYTTEDTITVSRKLYRSGESEYRINGKRVRLRDMQEFWMDCAVGAYTFMGQGRVNELVQARPQQVRGYIEEAAQIVKFRKRLHETRKKFENAEAHLEVLDASLSEEEKMLAYLERQARKARSYRELMEQKRSIDHAWLRRSWEDLDAQVKGVEKNRAAQQTKLLDAQSALQVAETGLETIRNDLVRARQELGNYQQRQQEASATLARAQAEVQQLQASEDSGNQQVREAEERLQQVAIELKNAPGASDQAVVDDDPLMVQEQALEKELADCERLLLEARNTYEQQRQDMDQARRRLMELERKQVQGRNARVALETKLGSLQADCEQLQTEQQNLQPEQARTGEELATVRTSLDEAERTFQEAVQAHELCKEALDQARQQLRDGESDQRGVERDLAASSTEEARLRALLSQPDQEEDAALQALREADVLLGRLDEMLPAGTLDVDTLEALLGPLLAAWVVDPAASEQALQLLRTHATRSRFLLPDAGASVQDLCARLVSAAEANAYGMVLESGAYLRQADGWREIGHHQASGLLTVRQQLASTVALQQELQDRAASLVEVRKTDEESLQAAESAATASSTALEEKKTRLREAQDQLRAAQRAADSIEHRLASATKRLQERQTLLQQVQQEMQGLQDDPEILAQQEQCTQDLAQTEQAGGQQREAIAGLEANRTALANQLHEIRSQLRDARARAAERVARVTMLQNEQQNLQQQIAAWQDQSSARAERIALAEKQQAQATQDHQALTQQFNKMMAHIDALDQKKGSGETEVREHMRTVAGLESETARLTERMEGLHVRVEELDLEAREHHGVGVQDCVVEPELAEISRQELHERRLSLEARVRKLGGVEPEAEEEYAVRKEEYEGRLQQKQDLLDSIATLTQAMEELKEEASNRFAHTFAQIDKHFREVFPRLFPGGRAELRLDAEDEKSEDPGVQIMAYPPGKRFERMELLSGGEKSLTATALILSIFLCNPSPFCLLDELDAPLDDVNLDLLASVLREMNEQSQVVLVTHNKATMRIADRVYGVTTDEPGVSTVYSMELSATIGGTE